jgi:hypothetical protein
MSRHKHRSPVPRSKRVGFLGPAYVRLPFEHAQQRVRMRCQEILPTQVAEDAVARATEVPVGLDQPDVLVAARGVSLS